ncbi:hypothetical protein EON65_52840 [archaeon]|nr:MAG: hypothetical protein EON65_52840 [archaeon]
METSSYHTNRPNTGRPPILDDRTKRRLARMALRGVVETATELATSPMLVQVLFVGCCMVKD